MTVSSMANHLLPALSPRPAMQRVLLWSKQTEVIRAIKCDDSLSLLHGPTNLQDGVDGHRPRERELHQQPAAGRATGLLRGLLPQPLGGEPAGATGRRERCGLVLVGEDVPLFAELGEQTRAKRDLH